MTPRPVTVALAAAVTALSVASCASTGGGGATATSTPGAVDACVVGSWKSASISGGITIAGSRVTLTGGAGELLTITAAGTIRTDDTSTAPLSGTAADGSTFTLSQRGTATGSISATGGQIAVKLDQPTPLTVTLSKDGSVVQSQHPGSATDSYTCSARTLLVITGAGGTVSTYAPS